MASKTITLRAPNGKEWEQPTGLFINNEFVESTNPENTIVSIDPATEKEIAAVQAATPEDIDHAVKAAKKALKSPEWKLLPNTDRGRLMFKLADLMEQNHELLATIDAWDNGKCAPTDILDQTDAYRQAVQRSIQRRPS
jgi:aldehyde dehydrogenase (NAD+)